MNFATLQGLTIPEGVVTQIADASGRVIWALSGGKVILEVEKITADTYAGETTYTGEQFILLDIYPKTNGTVKITYGGLTKTITDTSGAAEPNAQQVFFGTFNGVSDSVTTPTSGELTIEGDCAAFGIGTYSKTSKDLIKPCYTGITAISDFGGTNKIVDSAFGKPNYSCTKITTVEIQGTVASIGDAAFFGCTGLKSVTIKNGVKNISHYAFNMCRGLLSVTIPASLTTIGNNPFNNLNKNNILNVDSKNTSFKMDGNCLIEVATNRLISGFLDSIIPSYVTSIGIAAFHYFEDLTSIVIPAAVTSIGDNAFFACRGLSCVTMLAGTPPALGEKVFHIDTNGNIIAGLTITVPKGCGEAYKAADGWSEYADYIVEAS